MKPWLAVTRAPRSLELVQSPELRDERVLFKARTKVTLLEELGPTSRLWSWRDQRASGFPSSDMVGVELDPKNILRPRGALSGLIVGLPRSPDLACRHTETFRVTEISRASSLAQMAGL
ncbi:hypothetical protein HOY80DRAFT_1028087 [Tuber brumale]|nr:hypothetical protein HOY80DRAFT_1028087 [Tuber brumale]